MDKRYRIAVIPGDGIGKEVVPEGIRVLEAAGRKFGIAFAWDELPWSCDYYVKHGRMMPEDWFERIYHHEAIYFGAVGWPATVPDHVSLWGSLIQWRRGFDQYVNLRPCRLMPGVPSPLANRKPGEIDFVVVRENTEGEYSSVGGRMFEGTEREVVFQQTVFTRKGVDRILRFAFELAQKRAARHVTSATKSNGISIPMPRGRSCGALSVCWPRGPARPISGARRRRWTLARRLRMGLRSPGVSPSTGSGQASRTPGQRLDPVPGFRCTRRGRLWQDSVKKKQSSSGDLSP